MPTRGVVRRERKNHSNLRPKHKHTKHYLKHYWPYLPMVLLIIVGLAFLKPVFTKPSTQSVLAAATNVSNQDLLVETNEERTDNKLTSLRLNSQLAAAAQAKAQDMVSRNYWSHDTPEGSPPWTFIAASGYHYQKAGENLAYGFDDSASTVKGWMNSPTHRANILDEDYLDVGFGIATSNNFKESGPMTVIVAMYGRSANEIPTLAVSSPSTPQTQSYNTNQKANASYASQNVSKADLITGTQYSWITPLLTFIMGVALAILAVKHSLAIKKGLKRGERYIVKHPAIDLILVIIIISCLAATRNIGAIL